MYDIFNAMLTRFWDKLGTDAQKCILRDLR